MADQALGHEKPGADDVGPLQVQAHWDAAAEVWWAESDDLPGLATEAPSFSELINHIKSLAPTIIQENLGRRPDGLFVRVAGDASEETFRIDG
jgi:predicted RNase H-like HicB family nuclease